MSPTPLPADAETISFRVKTPNIHQRISAVQEQLPRVGKNQYNPHHKYAYVGHEDITELLSPLFVKNGIVQIVDMLEWGRAAPDQPLWVKLSVTWCNVDNPQDNVQVFAYGESQPGGKGGSQPQQVGVARSYALKFVQAQVFMLRTGDTNENEGRSSEPGRPEQSDTSALDELQKAIASATTPGELRTVAEKCMKQKSSLTNEDYQSLAQALGKKMNSMKENGK